MKGYIITGVIWVVGIPFILIGKVFEIVRQSFEFGQEVMSEIAESAWDD